MGNLPKQFRCRIGEKIYGPVDITDLRKIPGFTLSSLVAPINEENWQPAHKAIELSEHSYWQTEPGKGRILDIGLLDTWSALADRGPRITIARHRVEMPKRPARSPLPPPPATLKTSVFATATLRFGVDFNVSL